MCIGNLSICIVESTVLVVLHTSHVLDVQMAVDMKMRRLTGNRQPDAGGFLLPVYFEPRDM